MINRDDIQVRKAVRPLRLSEHGELLVSALLNAWIDEGGGDKIGTTKEDRERLAADFRKEELPALLLLLRPAGTRVLENNVVNSIDIIHWLIPQWPDALRQSNILGFHFDKE